MKKTLLILVLVTIGLLFAAEANVNVEQANKAFSISSRSGRTMDIRFVLPQYEIKSEALIGSNYQKIYLPNAEYLAEDGMPELPVLSTTIAIPARGGVQLEVLNSQHSIINNFMPYPVQPGNEESPKSANLNSAFYFGSGQYPSGLAGIGEPSIIRDFRIVTINLTPFVWDAGTGQLRVNSEIDFRLTFTDEASVNELVSDTSTVSASFAKIYESMILNFDDYRNMIVNQPPRYLAIYGHATDPAYIAKIDEWVFWNRQKGANVTAVSTNVAGTSNTAIKTYIQTQYDNPNTRPDFIILIGDTSGSFTIPTFTVGSFPGDYPYTHLAGGDFQGDAIIGRISAENLSQLDTILAKGYAYEKNLNIAQAAWLNGVLLVGDWAPSGISTMYISKYFKEISSYVNPQYTYTELYGSDPSPTAMNTAMNQGVGFFNYRGYLGMSGWSPNESNLFNGNKLPHAIIITCGTGNFNGGTATTESFIRLGTAAAPKGAVTAIGMATSSTHTSFNNTLNGGIINGIFTHGMRTMGEAMLNGKLYLHQIYGVSSPSNAQNFAMMGNLMGDPTLEVWVGIPGEFTLNVQSTIPVGLSLLDVEISSGGSPIDRASVTMSQGTTIIARGYTDEEGHVILVLPENIAVGDAVITVSKHNFKPLQQTITVENSGTLVAGPVMIDDDNDGESSGNNNGVVNNGETVELLLGIRNTGTNTITGINGYITTTNPYVTFSDSLVTYPNTGAGILSFNLAPVVMHVAPDAPDGTMLRLHIMLTDSMGNSYDISEFIPVSSPKLRFMSYQVTDGGNQALDPGESSAFNITLQNNGGVMVTDLHARLYTMNDLVAVTDNLATFGDIAVGGLGATTGNNFTIQARPEILPGMLIPMRLRLFNDMGFEQFVEFTLTVGVVTITDPLGPDTYGYVIYDDNDNYDLAPVYDWVGIAPAEGGQGVALPISDVYVSSNEGDQVGATSLAVVNLPFPFQFYGRTYEQITVCSNGFIALGVTENAEFRNFRLPGAMGPNPMIAAFWDDLATHSGSGIYTWFDRNNHAFVIEWYNMKNGYNGSSEETFQIILYDQSVYTTSLGDGPIKIQYKVFNNVNAQSGNRHGNFSTIGIVDHTGLVGLEYSFNNQYPTAASPLGNLRALYITNIPVYHEAAHVIMGETYVTDSNGNRVVEPGENVKLGIQLTNIGNVLADGITAVLSTNDEYITMINDSSEYFPLPGGETSGVNRTPFEFEVADNCPNQRIINFVLTVSSGEYVWERNFSVRVDASVLQYESYLVNDHDAEFDGIISAGETVKIIVNLKNASDVTSRDVMANLTTSNPFVNIHNTTFTANTIPANKIMQMVYDVTFNAGITPNTYVSFQFDAFASNGNPMSTPINIPFEMTGSFNDFELDNGGFVAETGWQWGTPSQVTAYSGSKVWATGLSGNYPDYVVYNLYSPVYVLTENPSLSFYHRYGIENNYDGANVSISTNGGNTWTVINPVGGYTHNSIPSLDGQPGYSGNNGNWQSVTFPLSAYAGNEVMFRFKFASDGQISSIGWFIDNLQMEGISNKTGFIFGEVIPTSGISPTLSNVVTDMGHATHPMADGMYRIYVKNGTYSANAYMDFHQSSSANNLLINAQNLTRRADFTLINLPKPMSVSFNVDNSTGLFTLNWNEPYDPVLPVVGYKVYRKFDSGPYNMVMETTGNIYTETLSLHGRYMYYVTVKYINIEGEPSDIVSIPFPYVSDDENIDGPGLVTALKGNYPNPFNPTTTIRFDLAKAGDVSLKIYNIKGQMVKNLYSGQQSAGRHQIVWNGKDASNRPVASGVYFYRLETKGYTSTRKMLMMK